MGENLPTNTRTRCWRRIVMFFPLVIFALLFARSRFTQDVITCNRANGEFISVSSYRGRVEIFVAQGFSGSSSVNYYSMLVNEPRAANYRFGENCTSQFGFAFVVGRSDLLKSGNSMSAGDAIGVVPYWAILALAIIWAKVFEAIWRTRGEQNRRLRGFSIEEREA